MTCGEVKYSPDEAREFGEPYSLAHITINRADYVKGDDCLSWVLSGAQQSQSKNVLVLTHGYNNDFVAAIRTAVGFGRDINFDGLLLVWCWPSEGSSFAYKKDERANAWSTTHYVNFFRQLVPALQQGQVDFIAHSMGSHILLRLVMEVNSSPPFLARSVIFAAPDVDQSDFKAKETNVAGGFQTLYAFADDWPLLVSKYYNRAGPRAGQSGDDLFLIRQLESVDASAPGHSAIFQDPYVIEDFAKLLQTHEHAARRGLIEQRRGPYTYWKLLQ